MGTTCIKNAGWVIAWDDGLGRQTYRRDIDVAFTDDRIVHVGQGFSGDAETTIDGRDLLVMPGLVDIHSHPTLESAYRGIREEHGVPEQYDTGLYERSVAYRMDDEARAASAEVAYCEMLQSGVTSVCDLSSPFDGWADLAAKSGLRGFLAPGFQSARWRLERPQELGFAWDEAAGRRGFEAALALIDELDRHPSGRLSGIVYPAQIETCTEDLFRDGIAAAKDRNKPITTHISQSVLEFREMVRRHGKTPVQWAAEIGLLGPNAILGHAIFLDHHSGLYWRSRRDLGLLAASGSTVAHCPSPFARYGQTLQHFGAYVKAGVNMCIGTDVAPHNLIEEMRLALVAAKITAGDIHATSTAEVFDAATVNGARALLRDDIGRIAAGAKADIVLVDQTQPLMRPVRDPLRALVFHAADRAVRDVFVDGRQVVKGGAVLTLDWDGACARLQEGQRRMIEAAPQNDYAGRTADSITPLALQ